MNVILWRLEFCCILLSRVFYKTINLIGLKHHIVPFEWQFKFQISFSFYLESVHACMDHASARVLGRVYRQNWGLPLCGPLLYGISISFSRGLLSLSCDSLNLERLWVFSQNFNCSEKIKFGLPAKYILFCIFNLLGIIYLYLNSSF